MKGFDIISFADNNTLYMYANNDTNLVKNLEDSASFTFKWFHNNKMQVNTIKCRILCSKNGKVNTKVVPDEIKNSQSEKL